MYIHTNQSDLALEAEFLASLVHPNIIKLRGISHGGATSFHNGPSGYFLVIDRLFDTLDAKMRQWRRDTPKLQRMSSMKRSITKSFTSSGKSKYNRRPTSISIMDKPEILDERFHIGKLSSY
jgi:hypothetical protein